MIPTHVKIKNDELPPRPGVYFMKNAAGKLLYIGKATSLKSRVSSYFVRPADDRIAKMVTQIAQIDYQETPTAIEALMLEAELIKRFQPPYNVMEKDDKSFVYLVFTKDPFPEPELIRGHELVRMPKNAFLKTFGPFQSAAAVRAALDALRKAFPWTTCKPGRKRACFYRHLGMCPGVCTDEITSKEYKKIIRGLILVLTGKRSQVLKQMTKDMANAAKSSDFETAAKFRDRLYALEHVRDLSVMKRETPRASGVIDIYGRIEAYDISNTLGEQAVGSMVVMENGIPKKSEYRKFRIKTITGANDFAMIEEVLTRRFSHDIEVIANENDTANEHRERSNPQTWPTPDLLVIDGGWGQVNAAKRALAKYNLNIPMVGLAKGFDRKQDVLVYRKDDFELGRLAHAFKPFLQKIRDEAHRFAISYHRKLRGKKFLTEK